VPKIRAAPVAGPETVGDPVSVAEGDVIGWIGSRNLAKPKSINKK
jgi:hypothetical protein